MVALRAMIVIDLNAEKMRRKGGQAVPRAAAPRPDTVRRFTAADRLAVLSASCRAVSAAWWQFWKK
jgi:hypothetical protein